MCVIVDTNIADRVLLKHDDPDFSDVNVALKSGKVTLVYGDKLAKEYSGNQAVRKFVVSLARAGIAHRVRESLIDAELNWLEEQGGCESNDRHIIALARASGARILCSNDGALGRDFNNIALINKPKGKIYKNSEHKHLLKIPCRLQRQ